MKFLRNMNVPREEGAIVTLEDAASRVRRLPID